MTKIELTGEQQAVVDAITEGFGEEQSLVAASARAGTGKTTTILAACAANPYSVILILAYNKKIADEIAAKAKRLGLNNVQVMTIDSLTWNATSKAFLDKLSAGTGGRGRFASTRTVISKPTDVAKFLKINDYESDDFAMSRKSIVTLAMRTVEAFSTSDGDKITSDHLPVIDDIGAQAAVLKAARLMWKDIQSTNGQLRYTFTHMTKMFLLSGKDLTASKKITTKPDLVIIDEAQDVVMALAKYLEDKHRDGSIPRIAVVGDPCQQIYEWRGAVNAIERIAKIGDATELLITESHRFGPEIADFANTFLDALGETGMKGHGSETRIGRVFDPTLVLTRTNLGLVEVARDLQDSGQRVWISPQNVMKMRSIAFHAIALRKGQAPHNPYPELLPYSSWDEVRKDIEADHSSSEVASIFNFVERCGVNSVLDVTDKISGASPRVGDVVVCTAHSAKGLESDRVVIHDDFKRPNMESKNPMEGFDAEEIRLMYVAVTRCQEAVDLGPLADVAAYIRATGWTVERGETRVIERG